MSTTESDVPAAPGAPEGQAEMAGLVTRLVDGLQEPYRSTVVMRYFDDLDATQISRVAGVAPGTVRWRLKQALDEIRGKLDQSHRGDRRAWCLAMAPLLRKEIEAAQASGAGVTTARASFGAGAAVALTVLVGGSVAYWLWQAQDAPHDGDARRAASLARTRSEAPVPAGHTAPSIAATAERAPAPSAPADARNAGAGDAKAAHPVDEPEGASLWGTVREPDGSAAAGVRVFVRRDTGFSFGDVEDSPNGPGTAQHVQESVVTNGEGEFRVGGLPDQQYVRVYARSDASGWGWSRACFVRSKATLGPVQITLPPRGPAALELAVTNLQGEPAHDVSFVYWDPSPFYRVGRVESGQGFVNDGSVIQRLLVFDVEGRQGYAQIPAGATGGSLTGRRAIQLTPQPWIEFQLYDADERPVNDVTVTLKHGTHAGFAVGRFDARERPDEPIRVAGLPGEPVVWDIVAPGYQRVLSDPVVMTEENQTIRGILEPAVEWFGSVLANGQPVAGAEVQFHIALPPTIVYRSLRGFPLRAAMMASLTATTDVSGRFELNLGAGRAQMFARYRAAGYAWQMVGPLSLTRGETLQDAPFELERPGRIHGRVTATDPEVPLQGTIVGLTNGGPDYREVTVGPDGLFAFEDVAPGAWYLFPKSREVEHEFVEAMELVSIPPGWTYPTNCTVLEGRESYLELNVDRMRVGRVQGELRIAHGSPVGWNIVLRSGTADPFRGVQIVREPIGADGLFDVETPDTGDYLFHFEPPSDPAAAFTLLRPIEVGAEVTTLEAEWSLGMFDLEVVPGFEPPPGALLYGVTRCADGFQGVFSILPDAQGRQSLDFVPAGRGRIAYMLPGDSRSDPWSWSGVLTEFEITDGETTYVVLE